MEKGKFASLNFSIIQTRIVTSMANGTEESVWVRITSKEITTIIW